MTNKELLIKYLKQIWDNNDFIIGVVSNAASDENFKKIIRFIEYANTNNEPITSDDILALSVVVDGLRMNRE